MEKKTAQQYLQDLRDAILNAKPFGPVTRGEMQGFLILDHPSDSTLRGPLPDDHSVTMTDKLESFLKLGCSPTHFMVLIPKNPNSEAQLWQREISSADWKELDPSEVPPLLKKLE